MFQVIGFLVLGALFYFALARLELPLWVKLVSSAFLAMGFVAAFVGAKQRFLAAQRINRFLDQKPSKESLTEWLKQNGIAIDGKADEGASFTLGACLFLAVLLLAFYLNPWSPTLALEYVGWIIVNVSVAATVCVIGYRTLEAMLNSLTRKTVHAVLSSKYAACEELVKEDNWQAKLSVRDEKRRTDLDLGMWVVFTVLVGVLLDRFLPWSAEFYATHRFVCAFISIFLSGVVGLVAAAALHYAGAKYEFQKKEILGIALACLIAPAILGTLGGVNHLSGDSTRDVFGFERPRNERSGGFRTRSQRRENLVKDLFGYVTSGHGLASLGTAIAVGLPFILGSVALLAGSMRSHLWKEEYQSYNFVGLVLGVIGLIIWISS